jgi:competence protein ComEC
MKRRLFVIIVGLLVLISTSAFASSVTLEKTIYNRDDGESIAKHKLTVHFIDVGGGDAILLNTPSNKKIIIDAGWTYPERALARKEYYKYLDNFLKDDTVDLVIITHPDYDHFSGLGKVLNSNNVKQIWYTGYHSKKLSKSWKAFLDKIVNKNNIVFLSPIEDFIGTGSIIQFDNAGTPIKSDDVQLTIISAKQYIPSTAYGSNRSLNEGKRRNSSSLVIRLDFGKTSFLFTGDTNGRKKWDERINACDDQELFMVEQNNNPNHPLYGKLDCTVLKVAHHGSDGSSSLPFLAAVHPKWAVISAGVPHEHPDNPVLSRLKHQSVGLDDSRILRTDHGEDNVTEANEENLGDDCYQFLVDLNGIVKITKWNVHVD